MNPIPTASHVWEDLQAVRSSAPLVHNITNYVVMNNTANALLAAGASPVMAHALEEVEDMAGIAGALVVNIGTLSPRWVDAMEAAMRRAGERGIPIVLDPVGAGATLYRTQALRRLLEAAAPTHIRGNGSEVMALLDGQTATKGVDSTQESGSALGAARALAGGLGCAVVVSGAVDYIVPPPGGSNRDAQAQAVGAALTVGNGHALMTRVTGLGCTASALVGAFAAVVDDPARAAASAMCVLGVAGEIAAAKAAGPGTLQLHLLDALHSMEEQDIATRARLGTDA